MLQVLLAWIYAGMFIFLAGNACVGLHNKISKCADKRDAFSVIFAGIMATTMFAQIYSIFGPLNMVSNLVLAAMLIIYALFDWKNISNGIAAIRQGFGEYKKSFRIVYCAIIIIMIIVYTACSAGVEKLIDTEWYHAQNIHWLEDYGCVKGVANLLFPLGFNSPQHYFDAVFSQKFIWNQSVRFSGGLFGVIICLHGLNRVKDFFRHKKHIADVIAVGEIIYSVIITAFFADPYTDTLPNILILFIATEWFALLENESADTERMGWLCILGVFATTVKSSAAMIVLFAAYPATLLLKEKKYRRILVYITEGVVVCIPYLVTNIITTGYPIYLVSSIYLPGCNWRINPAILQYAVDDMVAFARMPGVPITEALNCGIRWIPVWFANESLSHQILYLALVVMIAFDIIATAAEIIRKKKISGWSIYTRICIYLGLVYWMCTIPQVKYCWSYLILPLCIVPMCHEGIGKLISIGIRAVAVMVGILFLGFYSLRTLGYTKDGIMNNAIKQQDYIRFTFDEIEVDGLKFYIKSEEGDIACGYYVFPQMDNRENAKRIVVGDSYGDGFYFR